MIYEATITFLGLSKRGDEKTMRESFIIADAQTFSDAENEAYKLASGRNDFDVVAIKRSKIKEIANSRSSEDDLVWIAEVCDKTVNDEGEETEIVYKIAFYAPDFEKANTFIAAYLLQGYNFTLAGLKRTRIVDVI